MGRNKEKLRAMIRELGDAISDNLIQSDDVQNVLQRIKDHGYQVDLSLAVGVCLYKDHKDHEEHRHHKKGKIQTDSFLPEENADQELRFEINQSDLEFLNSLHIRIDKEIQ
jgi:hypothetical protein